MSTVISSGQNDKIVEQALEIMESMFSFSMESALNKNRLSIAHLKKLGFHGIPECGLGFNNNVTTFLSFFLLIIIIIIRFINGVIAERIPATQRSCDEDYYWGNRHHPPTQAYTPVS